MEADDPETIVKESLGHGEHDSVHSRSGAAAAEDDY